MLHLAPVSGCIRSDPFLSFFVGEAIMRNRGAILLCRPTVNLLRLLASALVAVVSAMACAPTARGDEAQWIWSPAYEKETAPPATCYFRKTFSLGPPEHGEIQIACDHQYELFVNGRQVGSGQNWKVMDSYDVTKFLVQGINTVAVKATSTEPGSAGLVARVVVKQQGNTHVPHSTDANWKTSLKEFPQWQKSRFNDSQWLAARSHGPLGTTLPWGNDVAVAGQSGRFKVVPEFKVEWVIEPQETGSLIAMTFDEFGQVIASRENGPLIMIRDDNKDGVLDSVSVLCDEVKNCQGILSVSGKVFVVGQGPQGVALYRLSDEDQDGKIDRVEAILKFSGEMSEHGPHALVLGPDGLIYMVVGNFAHVEKPYEATSPHHHFYEGDLVTPRIEDAGGHAAGIRAPGGTIIRTDTSGSAVELFAGGLQNPYDIAFNKDGELFTADSDMEWDMGMSWYRPTRVNHVVPGAEFGWRSGWAKWPDYYLDSLPPMLETGRGSPTGIEVYNHFMYPLRYHNALFVCDWSRGRILAVKTRQHGATYKATSEVFVEGQPLNVTDIAVGPDGWLYFCTGGRETEGGLFRIVWQGDVPAELKQPGKGLMAAIRQPQINSAWARQKVALTKKQMGQQWTRELTAFLENTKNPIEQRMRALDLMQLFGPYPTKELLIKISKDAHSGLRGKTATLMGIHADETTGARLVELLSDSELAVQRQACEALTRAGQQPAASILIKLLASSDRHVAWAAMRGLEQIPVKQWKAAVLDSPDTRIFLMGSTALLAIDPPTETARAVLDHASQLLEGYLSDADFLDLMRVIQLAVLRGEIAPDSIAGLRKQLADEYPSQNLRMNRELVRLLVALQDPTVAERMVQHLESDIPNVEKMHVAMHAAFLQAGWTMALKLDMLQFFEEARALPGGKSFAGYIENVSREFFAQLNDKERARVLAEGVRWPTSALSVLAKIPEHPSPAMLRQIENLDRQVKQLDTDAARRLRIGIAAVLGAHGDAESMAYLREVFDAEPDRRVPIAMALAQNPEGENWEPLVRALPVVEGAAAQEVLMKLATVDQQPDKPEAYRQVILRGLMLRDNGSRHAIALLEKWTGKKRSKPDDSWEVALGAWQQWFASAYPHEPEAKLPVESAQNQWTYQELLSYLTGPHAAHGDSQRGAAVFEKAQCIKCHRYGDRGDSVGPDLSTVSQRFQKKEVLESILFPSQVISDQYASQTIVLKTGATVTGMTAPAGDGSINVLQINGEKLNIAKEDIEESARSKMSAMPEGLLNELTLEEIADLFQYLNQPPQADVARRPDKRIKIK